MKRVAIVSVAQSPGKESSENLLDQVKSEDPFILGMSDNVPVNADFERVKKVASILERHASKTMSAEENAHVKRQ